MEKGLTPDMPRWHRCRMRSTLHLLISKFLHPPHLRLYHFSVFLTSVFSYLHLHFCPFKTCVFIKKRVFSTQLSLPDCPLLLGENFTYFTLAIPSYPSKKQVNRRRATHRAQHRARQDVVLLVGISGQSEGTSLTTSGADVASRMTGLAPQLSAQTS